MKKNSGSTRRGGSHWIFIAVFFLFTVTLGWLGFYRHDAAHDIQHTGWGRLYRTLQLFSMESGAVQDPVPWELNVSRFLAPLVTLGTAIAAALTLFRDRVRSFRVRFFKDHVVICGLGNKGMYLAQYFRRQGRSVVVVEIDEDNAFINSCRELGAVVLLGSAEDQTFLRKARVQRAQHIVITTNDDSVNVEVASCVVDVLRSYSRPAKIKPTCIVHIVDLNMCRLFKQHPIFTTAGNYINIKVINDYENAARLLFDRHLIDHSPLAIDDLRRMHVILIGFGRMGQSILMQVVRLAHFANGKTTRITILAKNAAQLRHLVVKRYTALMNVCELEIIEGNADDPTTISRIVRLCGESATLPSVVFCSDEEHRNFSRALDLVKKLGDRSIPVLIRIPHAEGLARLLREDRDKGDLAAQVEGFGLLEETCHPEIVLREALDVIARAIHEHYRSKQLASSDVDLDDPSLAEWEQLDLNYKESNRQAADHIRIKLRSVGCDYKKGDGISSFDFVKELGDKLTVLAKMEHRRWMAERLLAGWKYTDGEKDLENRRQPLLVEWSKVPEEQQEKDKNVVRIIPDVLRAAGYTIYKRA